MNQGFEYYPRLADDDLAERLQRTGAVCIRGAKWCGKTQTALQQANSVLYMQDPDSYESNMMAAETKPSLLLKGESPRLIDEWQMAPQLWDAIRFDVDRSHAVGAYILTGSATPGERPKHSGVGRFSMMTMRPMSLLESRESNGQVSLSQLVSDQDIEGLSDLDVEGYAHLICRGGWPQSVTSGTAVTEIPRDYLELVAEEDVSRIDGVRRSPESAMLIMRAYARCVSTQADMATVRSNIKAHGDDLSRGTVSSYVSALRSLYVLEDLEAWKPSLRDKTRVASTPTRHFVDPSLAAAALGATPATLLGDLPTMGLLFESLAVRDLRVYVESMGGTLFHYHDDSGREADAVAVFRDGSWGLFEVKMGSGQIEEGAKTLLSLKAKIDESAVGFCRFLAVVTAGKYAFRRTDGVYVVPLACLKP